jgi:hypothetical protein
MTQLAQNSDTEEEKEQERNNGDAYTPLIYDGTLPAASGPVATALQNLNNEVQVDRANILYNFLMNPDRHLIELNGDTTPLTALIYIPNTKMVRLLYGFGIGTSGIGNTSVIDGNVLAMYGESDPLLGPPSVMMLPPSIRTPQEVKVMTHAQFNTALTGPNYNHPLLQAIAVQTTQQLMKLAPIPAWLAFDGFEGDIDAAALYERVLTTITVDTPMYIHLKHFLLACLAKHNAQDTVHHAPAADIIAQIPRDARRWAHARFPALFPTLIPEPAQQQAPPPPLQNPQLLDLLRQLLPAQANMGANGRNATTAEEEKREDTKNAMSARELRMTLRMCGREEDGDNTLLPTHFRTVMEKGSGDDFKRNLIREHIVNTTYFDDAEPPLTTTLLKMVLKRQWLGKEGDIKNPSLLNALEGLSPFLASQMTHHQIAIINEAHDDLTSATYTTVKDQQSFKSKFKIDIPENGTELLQLTKCYANMIFAIFGQDSPLFLAIRTVVNALKRYTDMARKNFSRRTIASIMWIMLLQCRTFGTGDTSILEEFQIMQRNLAAKNELQIYHSECPQELWMMTDKSAPKHSPKVDTTPQEPPKKKQRATNPNNWNERLKEQLTIPLQKAKNPSYSSILRYCGENPMRMRILNHSNGVCASNTFLGRCYAGDQCDKVHRKATDGEATKILAALKKFIDSPDEFKNGKQGE